MSVETTPMVIEAPQSALTLVRPIAQPTDLIAYHEEVTQIIQKSLTKGVDYDVIPGTGDKPSLLKPGAERLNLAFGAAPEYEIIEKEIDHDREVRWTKKKKEWNNKFKGDRTFTMKLEEGSSFGLYRYVIRCRIKRAGRLLAECIGTCSTLESKYIDRPRDCENTALKMAQKRAYVGATLHAYGLSNRFTQDVEDNPEVYAKEPPAPFKEAEIPFAAQAPKELPKTEKPKVATVYDHEDPSHQGMVSALLKTQKVDPRLWEEIGRRLHGRPSSDMKAAIAEVMADQVEEATP